MSGLMIGDRPVGVHEPPYIVAEMSANHNGDLSRAFEIVRAAKTAGADAVKLQTYRAESITLDHDSPDFRIEGGPWGGQTLYELYRAAQMPWEWHQPLFDLGRELDLAIFSSPFDHEAVEVLESLDAPAYKIASFEIVDIPLIRRVARTGKPVIISTGMATRTDIQDAVNAAREEGCEDLVVLQCVSGYPAPASEYNLKTIADIQKRFGVLAGLSDHSLDDTVAIASVALGAVLIEKHVTLDRLDGGVDAEFSIEPHELERLVRSTRTAWEALGEADYSVKDSEKGNSRFRRSLFFVRDAKKGEVIEESHVRSIRPDSGLPPKELSGVLGRRVTTDVQRGTPVSWSLLE